MARQDFVPDEKRSLRVIFFVASMVLVGTTVWALWDEAVSRRPWIEYQIAFNQLEYQMVQKELGETRARLNQPEIHAKLETLREELRWAEEAKKGPDYRKAVREVERQKAAYADISQELRFTRSELDEAFYWRDKAKHGGKDPSNELAAVKRLQEQERILEPQVNAAKRTLEEAQNRAKAYDRRIQEIRDRTKEITTEVLLLERRLEGIKTRSLEVKQVVVEGLDKNEFDVFILRVDRCQTCHLGIDRTGFENAPPPFQTHPEREALLGKHPVDQFGCSVCHEGQGTALDYEKLVDGRIPDVPHGFGREYGGSPNVLWDFPLLRGELVQSSCRKCHLERSEFITPVKKGEDAKVEWVDLAPTLTKGIATFEILGCHGCHPAQGFTGLPKVGPNLTRVGNKVEPAWLIQWVQDPQSYLPHTRMPNFSLSKEHATAIAAYLLDKSEPDPPVPGRFDRNASPEKGKEIFERVGCLGCHAIRSLYEEKGPRTFAVGKLIGRDFAPDLSNIAMKIKDPEWIFRWLKNPSAMRPRTPMPSLRLTDEDASALTAFLMTLGERQETPPDLLEALKRKEHVEEGERLIRLRGCFGCHEIRGFEAAKQIAPEISNFGHKRLLQLSFGDAVEVHHTWEDWTFWKMKDPQIYRTDREQLRMPNFRFSDEEAKTLRILLKSFIDTDVPTRFREEETADRKAIARGQRLVRNYNCVGCHVVEGKGGDVRMRYEGRLNEAPPPLVLTEGTLSEGEKVQAEWLFQFLNRPTPIRPWLEIRMPTFGLSESEMADLASYFVSLAGLKVPYEFVPPTKELKPELVEAGKILASNEYFACGSCHMQGRKKPEGPPEGWAPDFALAYQRLRPGWIVTWLKDPQKVQPGTNMPSYFLDEFSGPDEILGGDEQTQILALREYLLSLRPQ